MLGGPKACCKLLLVLMLILVVLLGYLIAVFLQDLFC